MLNPAVNGNSVTDSGAFSDYHALQIDLRRRLSQGLSASVNYQYALEGGSAFDGFMYGRTMVPSDNVRHAIKTQWDWTIPGRPRQRYLTDMNPWWTASSAAGRSRASAGSRRRSIDFGNVRLVGMTPDELQGMWKFRRVKVDPAVNNGLETVYMLPDDVILNTRRAFSTSSTSVNGYGALGAAGEAGTSRRRTTPAASRSLPATARRGTCYSARRGSPVSTSAFPSGSRQRQQQHRSRDRSAERDGQHQLHAGRQPRHAARRSSRPPGIYMDQNNTYDPGGRLGQLMFRMNW